MKKIGTTVIVLRGGDYVLLLKNARTRCWELPGGKLDEEESIIECAARELKEETSIQVGEESLEFIGYIEHNSRPTFENEEWLNMIYLVNYDTLNMHTPKITEPEKHHELRWFRIDRLPYATWNVACNCIIQLLRYKRERKGR